ncbi:hypothetical protein O0I10_009107 [Lichtheimia ornata]|uniref:Mtf2-like C-terminal domain-containing protein n=1 Tax=Lichtheimia ornata TaxID=688661 RepID=A0AAD7UX20_9FUNG|nr:uncharacterized protein O0I10_009107 [Lichtheimia ornata]KAJ8655239.1 hypothetical protein O0I10_009107 [Lichtheimia ornata]
MIPRVIQRTATHIARSPRSQLTLPCYRCNHSNTSQSESDPEQDDLLSKILDYKPPTAPTDTSHATTKSSSKSKFSSKETRDFGKLLDALWSESDSKATVPQQQQPSSSGSSSSSSSSSKRIKRIHSSIEKQLLDMVLRQSKPHKAKSPLPRSSLASFYKGEKQSQSLPATPTLSVKSDVTLSDRDEENKAIESILACRSSDSLVHFMKRQLEKCNTTDENGYPRPLPRYYDRLIERAVNHASMTLKEPYLAVAIFEQVKASSIESYVSGCTTQVYNELLSVRWKAWRDIHGMMTLVEEMMSNGIGYDGNTRRIIQMVMNEVETEMDLDKEKHGFVWSMDERRSVNIMKALVSKWSIKG